MWAENPDKLFCKNHEDRWRRTGQPDPGRFIADCELTGTAHIDLRDLHPALRMEFQYALQCRHDARARTAPPRLVMQAVRQARAAGVTSLLELPEQQWRQAAGSQVREPTLFLLDARDAVESLRDGTGWEVEYPRDVWRLHKLPGIAAPSGRPCPRARLRFDRITQPWLRDLGKRWLRLRLAAGLSIAAAKSGLDALTCFSQFLAQAGVERLADVDRPLLEAPSGLGGLPARRIRCQENPDRRAEPVLPGHPAAPLGRYPAGHRGVLPRRHPTGPRAGLPPAGRVRHDPGRVAGQPGPLA